LQFANHEFFAFIVINLKFQQNWKHQSAVQYGKYSIGNTKVQNQLV